jgi:uncharacterized protein (TIGR01777 family)
MNILITGSSGLIGTKLKLRLSTLGHRVFALVHDDNNSNAKKDLTWSIKNDYVCFPQGINIDVIIHLAGANIGKPWTKDHKKAILESRDAGTRLLVRETINQNIQPQMFISTSAIGLYPDPSTQKIDETGPTGSGFLSEVCQLWEAALTPLRENKIPVGLVRVGLVLDTTAGLFPVASKTRKLGIVPLTGSADNVWSWIHVMDLLGIFTAMVEKQIPLDIYNGVAPQAVTQKEFADSLIQETKKARQLMLPIAFTPTIPAFVLKWVMGEQSVLALTSQHVVSAKLPESLFSFKNIHQAIEDLIHD